MPKSKKTRASNYLICPEPYIMLPHSLIMSKEYNQLKPTSNRIYEILLTKWNREKDKAKKDLPFTYDELHNISTLSRQTIHNAITELEDKGFIRITIGGKNNPNRYKIELIWLCEKSCLMANSINRV